MHEDCDRLYLLNTCRHYRYQTVTEGSRHQVASFLKKKRKKKQLILRLHNSVHHSEEQQRNERESTQTKTNPSIDPSVSIALGKWAQTDLSKKNRNLKNCPPPLLKAND